MLDLVALSEEQFQSLWRARIEPLLMASEGPRLTALQERNKRWMIGLPIALLAAVGAYVFTQEIPPAFIFGGMAAMAAWAWRKGRFKRSPAPPRPGR